MTTTTSTTLRRSRERGSGRYLLMPRVVAGFPLLAIGLMHVVADGYGMRPLVEAAGLPGAAVLAPVAVAVEIAAGAMLLLGAFARVGAVLALPTMAVAAYAHLAIDDWPNAGGEPSLALPALVALGAAVVLLQGPGAWSLDARREDRDTA